MYDTRVVEVALFMKDVGIPKYMKLFLYISQCTRGIKNVTLSYNLRMQIPRVMKLLWYNIYQTKNVLVRIFF